MLVCVGLVRVTVSPKFCLLLANSQKDAHVSMAAAHVVDKVTQRPGE